MYRSHSAEWKLSPEGYWWMVSKEEEVRPPVSVEEEVRPPVSVEDEVRAPVLEEVRPPVSEQEEVWPPVWKPVEKSPEYRLISIYLGLGVDDFAHVYPPGSEDHELIKRFFQQVRESRGYDLDCPPCFLNSPFFPRPLESLMDCEIMSAQVKFVTAEINAQAEMHGEKYVLDKMEKLVDVSRYRIYLHTFTVKQVVPNPGVVKTVQAMVFLVGWGIFELREWRFKPQ